MPQSNPPPMKKRIIANKNNSNIYSSSSSTTASKTLSTSLSSNNNTKSRAVAVKAHSSYGSKKEAMGSNPILDEVLKIKGAMANLPSLSMAGKMYYKSNMQIILTQRPKIMID